MRRRSLTLRGNQTGNPEVKGHHCCVNMIHCDGWLDAFVHADLLEEEAEFNWEEYMEETGATGVPHNAFRHVSAHFDLCL